MYHIGKHRSVAQGEKGGLECVVGFQFAAFAAYYAECAVAQVFQHNFSPWVPAQHNSLARLQVGHFNPLSQHDVARWCTVAVMLTKVVIVTVTNRSSHNIESTLAWLGAETSILPETLDSGEADSFACATFNEKHKSVEVGRRPRFTARSLANEASQSFYGTIVWMVHKSNAKVLKISEIQHNRFGPLLFCAY